MLEITENDFAFVTAESHVHRARTPTAPSLKSTDPASARFTPISSAPHVPSTSWLQLTCPVNATES